MTTAEFLLARKLGKGSGSDVTVEALSVIENGTYSEEGKAYSPVTVNVPETPLSKLTVTENGTYTAPTGTGYGEVDVDVPLPENAYLLQTIEHEQVATFTDGTDNFLKSLEVAIEPIQSGSGEPSPTNIRPISGWNEVNVTRCGKNLFDQTTWQYYNMSRKTNATNIPSLVTLLNSLPVGNYTFSAKFKVDTVEATQTYRNYGFYVTTTGSYSVENYTRVDSPTVGAIYETSITINKSDADIVFNAVYIYAGRGSVSDTATIYDMQLESGTTSTTYSPYNGHTYTIDLNGTRYGGKVDLVSGVLTVTGVSVVYDGSNDESWAYLAGWSKTNTNAFYLPTDTTIKFSSWDDHPISKCNCLTPMSRNELYDADTTGIGMSGSLDGGNVSIRVPKTVSDVSELRTWLSTNNVQAYYELATPLTIQLSPTIIKSLQGDNNFFASTGEIERMQYWGKETA